MSAVAQSARAGVPRGWLSRLRVALSAALAGFLGLLPHVLHHIGPLAGAALFAGVGGSLLFGAIGLVAAVPFLLRVRRRCGHWRTPALLLVLFTAVFSVSTFLVGPAISGSNADSDDPPASAPQQQQQREHEAHH